MNMADRIQNLRKIRGISQEQLADKIGVSRQAVSKWESEQSTPDIEKVVLLSEFFDVSTDYLLKGIEPSASESKKEKPDAGVFAIVGTAFNFMGIIVSAMIWYEEQVATATAIGLIFIVMGCMIYSVGMIVSDETTKAKAKRIFSSINIWTITFIPLSILYNILSGGFRIAPYPIPVGSIVNYALFWIIYIVIGVVFNIIIHKVK